MSAATDPADRHDTLDPPSSLISALRQIGPGLILAAAIVGTGELIATTNLGAMAGFALLWLVLLSCFIKVFVQIELGRYAISTNRTTFQAFSSLPGPGMLLVWWCAGMILVTQFQVGAMLGGVGQTLHLALPGLSDRAAEFLGVADRPEVPWAVLTTVVTAVLLVYGGYGLIEKFMTLLVVGFTVMTVGCIALLPPETSIRPENLASGFRFQIPGGLIGKSLAMFGITGVGANELLSYPYWCLEKGYARNVGPADKSVAWADRARGWMRVLRLDAWVSMLIYTIATLGFYLLGAAVLHRHTAGAGLPDTVGAMLEVLTDMYEPVFGPALARWFLVLGAFSVLYSTIFAATAGTSRLLADFLGVLRLYPADDSEYRRRWVGYIACVLLMVSLGLYLGVRNPVKMVTIGGIAQALSLPLIATAAIFLRYRRTDRRLAPGKVWDVFLWLSMVGLIASGVIGLSQTPPGKRLLASLGLGG